jgi:hypothetical protein
MWKPKEKEATSLILQVVGYLSPTISFPHPPTLLLYSQAEEELRAMPSAYAVTDV